MRLQMGVKQIAVGVGAGLGIGIGSYLLYRSSRRPSLNERVTAQVWPQVARMAAKSAAVAAGGALAAHSLREVTRSGRKRIERGWRSGMHRQFGEEVASRIRR
jgi:hypothetical protein